MAKGIRAKVSRKSLKAIRCSNLIHKRSNVSTRHCSSCGEIVNNRLEKQNCDEASHLRKAKEGIHYCSWCGENLTE